MWAGGVKEIVAEIRSGKTEFKPSEDACRWCGAKAFCASRVADLLDEPDADPEAAIAFLDDIGASKIDALTDEQIADIFTISGDIQSLLKDIGAYAYDRAMAGKPLPGTKLVKGRLGNRAWADEDAADQWMSNHLGSDDRYTKKVITPPQAEKLLKPLKLSKTIIGNFEKLITRKEGGLSIAPASDKRPAADPPIDLLND